jgi:hypothetical protein
MEYVPARIDVPSQICNDVHTNHNGPTEAHTMTTKRFFANPYDGTIAHAVHPDVVDFFITDRPDHTNPAHVNNAIEWNRSLAEGGYRCLHTNGNHTVWEGPLGIVTVSRCELPTVHVSRPQK